MAVKRVFAGYYKRYDGKRIYVVRVVKDIDTGEAVVICKDASFIREGNEEYYTIGLESFCEQVNVDGIFKDKHIRQTRREVEPEMIGEVTEDGFPEPKRPLCISLANRTNATSGAVKRTMNMPRTSVKTTGWICGGTS